jgi:hypothetical protein
MKYYCENCGNVLIPNVEGNLFLCDTCITADGAHKIMAPFPDYETPAEYKARTGKELSDDAQIWIRRFYGTGTFPSWENWFPAPFSYARKILREWKYLVQVLFGDLEPPPGYWKGE